MSLADIVAVNISIQKAAIIAQGFGVPMILGQHTRFGERFRIYTSTAAMLTDGFVAADPEYKAAVELMSQEVSPSSFVVGKRLAPVAQVTTITPTAVNLAVYTVSVVCRGKTYGPYTYTADGTATAAEIVTGLIAQINADAAVLLKITPTGSTTLILTAVQPGDDFSVTIGANLAQAATTPNSGVAEDLTAIQGAGAAWYGIMLTSRIVDDQQIADAWIEASTDIPYIGVFQSSEAAAKSAAYNSGNIFTDGMSHAHGLAFKRSTFWYHATDSEYLDAALLGSLLPRLPGSATWALKQLVGVTVDTLTSTERSNLDTKAANYFYPLTSQVNISWPGKMASGEWIDNIIAVDWLRANIAAAVANIMLSRPKVPFTDDGLQLLGSAVMAVLQQAEDAPYTMLAKSPKFAVSVPKASAFSGADKTARSLANHPITFSAQFSGAIHSASPISGQVSN